ncbi:MAG: hypothetical protein LBE09_07995 [Christensenellaceae bacterium]|jgi:bifunctional UDP-N-acetylglucosamine pyrophosphorylase/glucosamine-1-phosphate N-acetyltransferase|nr:hypothetical protein [Christensenellaceae bacterium]
MTGCKIYIVKANTMYDDIDIFGVRLFELLINEFQDAALVVDAETEIDISNAEVLAVLYTDTPLITREIINKCFERAVSEPSIMTKIGSGFVKPLRREYCGVEEANALQVKTLVDVQNLISIERAKIINRHMENGVVFLDFTTCYIARDAQIGAGTIVYPFNYIGNGNVIGETVKIFPYCDLNCTEIGSGTNVRATYAESAKVGRNCTLGPYTCLRPGSRIGDNCRVGDFVDIKNSILDTGVKVAHHAYVGDSQVGANSNVGCGTVFANYDGKVKRSVVIGKNVFVGCNSNLIAPLTVDDNAYIAAGSTVTQHVPGKSLCIARARQVNKPEYPHPKQEKT